MNRHIISSDLIANNYPDAGQNFFTFVKNLIHALRYSPSFTCVFWYRVNHYLYKNNLPLKRTLNTWRIYKFNNYIFPTAQIGEGFRLAHHCDVVIGGGVSIGRNVTVYNGVTIGANVINGANQMPKIGNNVFIGTGSKLTGNLLVGNNVIISALTFCNDSIPENSLAIGNPMVIKNRMIKSERLGEFSFE